MINLPKYSSMDTVGNCLKRSALRFPKKVALIDDNTRMTYKEFNEEANRFAHAIMKLGIKQGDKVTLMSSNSINFMIIWFGLCKAGITMVPMNLMLKGGEVSYIVNHSESSAFIVEDKFYGAMKDVMGEMKMVKHYIHINSAGKGNPPAGMIDYDEFMKKEKSVEEPLVEVDIEELAQIAYTSGTESLPKGVMLTHRALISQYVNNMVDCGLRTDDISAVTMPLFHCAQIHTTSSPHVYLGATQIIMPGFDPIRQLETIQKEKVTYTFGLPAQYRAMLAVPDFDKYDLSSLNICTYVMAPVSVEELKVWMEKIKPKRGFQIYFGQTEMAPATCLLNPEEHATKAGSLGRVLINCEMEIMDDDGNILPRGEIGEVVYRGGCVMKGYFKDEEKTKEAFKYGWFHSGDLCRIDADGYIWFEDRKKDMIKSGGENVASIEVEKCIYNFPGVLEVAVVGLPDPKWIEKIAAFVVPKPGTTIEPEALIAHCKTNLAGYKVPKQVEIVTAIPKTATGKIRKNVIRDMCASK